MIKVSQVSVGGFDDNFSYVLYDETSHTGAVVDPCGDIAEISAVISEYSDFIPGYILITHTHRDHISGICEVRKFFDAPVVAHRAGSLSPDIPLDDGMRLPFGDYFIEGIHTPGHTDDSVVYRLSDNSALFTGDTLFVDWCGYCSAEKMFETMRNKIRPLADSNIVYSGHNYGREPYSPLGVEKERNPYLSAKTSEEFKEALKNL
jgi:glyoxylase-like metal-dependent hydrolase (beta-lactamase superfamily II)